jgi:glycosyltransferase involved in cell wall biosynthesis
VTESPLVSVVLPVRNGEKYVREALDSVLAQTCRDFELVVVDDGSTDATPAVVAAFADERIRIVRQEPLGLVEALKRGLADSVGQIVARMDADDVSLPHRLERQVEILLEDSRVGLVGCGIEIMDAAGVTTGSQLLPASDAALRRRLLLRNPFTHGSMVIRREALDAAGGYRGDYGANEDYDLWRRIARDWRLDASREVLYRYREHADAVTKGDVDGRVRLREQLRDELWRDPSLLRALGGEREAAEARTLTREALRRRRYGAAARSLADALRATTSL